MKRCIRKAIAFSSAVVVMAALSLPSAAADKKPTAQCQVVLDNTYDATVHWGQNTLFIKNGSKDSVTDKTEMELAKPDGSVASFANSKKFDKIYLTGSYYTESKYLFVGKDGKQGLLKEDGSYACEPVYDNIVAASEHYMVVKEDGKYNLRKLDSTLVKSYPLNKSNISLEETDHSLIVSSKDEVLSLFDQNLKEIDLSAYDAVYYESGKYLEAKSDGYVGLIDDTGKEIVKPNYSHVSSFTYQGTTYFYAQYFDEDSRKATDTILNTDGSVLIDGPSGNYNLHIETGYILFQKDNFTGIYDLNSKSVKIPAKYTWIYANTDQYFAYQLDGKIGVQTYDGKTLFETDKYTGDVNIRLDKKYIIIETYNKTDGKMSEKADVYSIDGKFLFSSGSYDYVWYYQGMFIVENENGKDSDPSMGLLDDHGQVVVTPGTYTSLEPFYDSSSNSTFLVVSKDGKKGLLDSCGNVVVELKYQELEPLNEWNNSLCFITRQNNKYGMIKVTPLVSATGLSLDKTDAALKVGDTVTLTPKFTPAGTTDQKVTWSSSDESVATVKDGVVTALKAGEATITATSEDGGYKATCVVKVAEAATTTTTTNTTSTSSSTGEANSSTSAEETSATTASANGTAASGTAESPTTGETPVTGALTLLALSVLAMGWTVRKNKEIKK